MWKKFLERAKELKEGRREKSTYISICIKCNLFNDYYRCKLIVQCYMPREQCYNKESTVNRAKSFTRPLVQ